ncbi:MAG: carboxymuconolactone decarboxylase family protein [Verrucomicrobia bacterium]|nr:carboxymuconolactone decarboxylase family protein [Verrucomicrobiota bacterium]MBV8533190.1 carboxymuconolactone decarboxylase family protein [Verrucomicrobiota bacterium]
MEIERGRAAPPTNYLNAAPGAFKAMVGLESYLRSCGIEPSLIELVKLRISQLNDCAYCIDNHTKKLLASGESRERLHLLNVWRDASCYSEREKAAFAWAEAVTRISEMDKDESLYAAVQKHFTEKELIDLTLAIVAINGWNRLNIAFRIPPGFEF